METLLIILTTIMLLICVINKNYRRSPLMVFCGLWFSIIILYSLRLYGIYNSNSLTLFIYVCGIGAFCMGYMFFQNNRSFNMKYYHKDLFVGTKHRFFMFLLYVSIFFMVYRALRAIPLWVYGGAGAVKTELFRGDDLKGGGIENILYVYIMSPIQIASLIYVVISIFQKKIDKRITFLCILLSILFYIATASKLVVSQFALMFFSYIVCIPSNSIYQLLKKYKSYLIIAVVIISAVVFLLSLKGDLFRSIYFYLCGCIPMSDMALSTITSYPHFYGLITFNGIIRLIFAVPNFIGLGGSAATLIDYAFLFRQTFEKTTIVAPGQEFNSFISMFVDFYIDGGIWGVILLSFFFGGVSAKIKNMAFSKPSFFSIGLLLYVVYIIWTSMARIDIMMIYNVMALVMICLFFPKNSIIPFDNKAKENICKLNQEREKMDMVSSMRDTHRNFDK